MTARHFIIPVLALFLSPVLDAAHIGFLYPAGGQAGKTVEILVGGSSLWGISSARVTGKGVEVLSARSVSGIPHASGTQKKYLHEWLKRIENGDPTPPQKPPEEITRTWGKCRYWDDLAGITPLEREIVARKLLIPVDSLQSSPSIAGRAIVKLRIAPDAPPGRRELRLIGRGRISDPLPFCIDTIPEYREEPFKMPEIPQKPVRFTPPAVLNGQIFPGETDTFLFRAEKGEILTFSVRARALVPFLGDGVPGHFQAVLEVFDAENRRVGSADDHHFDPDPVLVFRAPHSGEYKLKVRDALYRGRNDFVYRIKVVRGKTKREKPQPPERFGGPWNSPAPGSEVTLPARIAFSIGNSGGKACWRFRGKGGGMIEAEVLARRLGSPLDAALVLRDADGKVLAANDDAKGARIGTILQQADPKLRLALPKDGEYSLEVSDASGTGGPEAFGYLKIAAPEPDFELFAYPSGIEAAFESPTVLRVLAIRRGGFDGRIVLSAPPESSLCIVGENSLEAGMERGLFTVRSTRPDRPDGIARPVRLLAFAELPDGRVIRRETQGADELMQAFAYTHLVPAETFVSVRQWGPPETGRKCYFVFPDRTLRLPPGGCAKLQLWQPGPPDRKLEFSLVDPPAGITLGEKTTDGSMVTFTLQAAKDAPTGAFNTVLRVRYGYTDKKGKRQKASYLLPAFRLEVTK